MLQNYGGLVEIPQLAPTASGHDIAAALDEADCCVLQSVLGHDVIDAISRVLEPYRRLGSVGASDFEGHKTRRTGSPLPRSSTFRTIAMHP